ncbi:MAG: IS630 family transposase, partial [Mariniphaga sp.]|nr:IS630 family transposase [Mariniphaga sp.]
CLDRRIADIETVIEQVNAWAEHRNTVEATINWQFKTEDARVKPRRLYPSINH